MSTADPLGATKAPPPSAVEALGRLRGPVEAAEHRLAAREFDKLRPQGAEGAVPPVQVHPLLTTVHRP